MNTIYIHIYTYIHIYIYIYVYIYMYIYHIYVYMLYYYTYIYTYLGKYINISIFPIFFQNQKNPFKVSTAVFFKKLSKITELLSFSISLCR